MAKEKLKIGGGTLLKRLIFCALLIWVVVNPLSAAMAVHDTFFWIRSYFS
jgi:hypothetical protein